MLNIKTIALKSILSFNFSSNFLVLIFVFFSIFNKLFYLFFWKSSFIVSDCNSSIFRSSFICGCHIHDTIFIYFKSNLYLWNSSWSWRNTIKIKHSQFIVIFSHWSFTFKDLNVYTWLIISIGGENLRFFSWNCSISLN